MTETLPVTLERLGQAAARPSDNVDLLRLLVARVHARIRAQDVESRLETLSLVAPPEHQCVEHLVRILEHCRDALLVGAVCSLFHDMLSPSNKGDLRQGIIHKCLMLNTAEVIFRTLKNLSVDGLVAIEPCIHPAYQVLAKLSSKDPKLAVKARLVGGVKLTHQLLQAYSKNSIPLLPLLMVTKFLSKNSTNQMVLGKEGCVVTMATILSTVPKTHWAKIKFIMETLALLTKTKSNVIRLVRESGLQRVLAILDAWEKIERRHQVKLIKGILGTLSHVCDSKHGRKAVMSLNGIEVVQRFIQACPADKKFDNNLASATNVFLKCISKGELPVSSVRGAFTFQGPSKDASPSPSDKPDDTTSSQDVDSSDDDAEEEVDDDEEDFEFSKDLKGIDITSEYSPVQPKIEELQKLAPLFPELNNFCVQSATRFRDAVSFTRKENVGECVREASAEQYLHASNNTKSLMNFVKVAYPDLVGAQGPTHLEELYEKDRKVCRSKAIATVERVLHPDVYLERVVYDLDYLMEAELSCQLITPSTTPHRPLSNWDEKRVGKKDVTVTHLNFESRFESGNLRRVIQASNCEYDLILNADVNSSHHHQWFYFEVSNMESNTPYTFNIINNEKPNSEFNFGMKPVMFSVQDSLQGKSTWVRTGCDICYHKNHYSRIPKSYDNAHYKKSANACYYTATFTVTFPHAYDVCYVAYHYPYTYTRLQTHLGQLESRELPSNMFYSNQILCHTLNGNPVPLLTITSKQNIKDKEVIFLTARVHPGESNSSWVMEGVLNFLMRESSIKQLLLEKFIFKIIPMLNPEGVIHGNQRCGLTDEDLNRRWRDPHPALHPTIYQAKSLLEYLRVIGSVRVRVFCDFHGHSRQKNVFMYGCSRLHSWWPADKDVPDDPNFMLLPQLAQHCMGTFSFRDCHFMIERARESTARVAVWRQFDIPMSYTMEASTCGCDQGPYKNKHLSTKQLLESGEGLCVALSYLASSSEVITTTLAVGANSGEGEPKDSTEKSLEDFSQEIVFWSSDLDDDDLDSDDDLDLDLYGTL